MVPLFPGIPGGPELLVILLMMIGLFFIVPLAFVVGAYLLGKRRSRTESDGDDPTESVE